MRHVKRTIMMMLLIALLVGITGCKGSEKTNTDPVVPFQSVADVKEGRPDIYIILKTTSNNYWQVLMKGAEAAAGEVDANIYIGASATENEWEQQKMLMEEAIANGAEAIIISPDDSTKLAPYVSEAYSANIKVVLIDTAINCDDYDVSFMTDNLLAGQDAAKEMLEQFEKKGVSAEESLQVAIQVGTNNSQTTNERLAGFCQYWTSNAPDNWTIVDSVYYNEGIVEKAQQNARDYMKQYDNVRGFFGSNNSSSIGFATVIAEDELTDVVMVGFDTSDELMKLIKDENYAAATMVQSQYDMGYKGVIAAYELTAGKKSDYKYFDTGVFAVNGENVDSKEIQEMLNR